MRFAQIFQDHAVLQRDIPLPVWGEAAPNTRVKVVLGSHSSVATADSSGRWFLRLPALPAGGPYTLTATAEGHPDVTLSDLLIGEVWIGSGQSNMEYLLSAVDPAGEQACDSRFSTLRLLTVANPSSAVPQSDVVGRWHPANPAALSQFSAVAGWFGRHLHGELNVPIGIIVNAWGGTRIQTWLSREALMLDPVGRAEITAYEQVLFNPMPPVSTHYASADDWFRAVGPENPGNLGLRDGWASPSYDHGEWPIMAIPSRWQDHGHKHSGIFWFRRRLALPPAWRGQALKLHLGTIDKHDDTYVNGHRVGGISWENLNSWCTPRAYEVPSIATATSSELVIAIRVRSHLYHGGMTGPGGSLYLHPCNAPDAALSLAGPWAYAIEQNWGTVTPPPFDNRGPGGCNAPYALFNSRLYPLIPYAIRGFIWYQGESNADEAPLYRRLLPLMIDDWRRVWGQGKLPFLQVQLANFQPSHDEPTDTDTWPSLRAAQASVLRTDPQAGLAVAIDVGEAEDIHPKDKKSVGQRLARWALSRVYGRPGLPSGPLLRACEPTAEGRLRLTFDYAAGLATEDGGPVRRIEIAGPDRKFRWAQSRIEGEQLLVWHPDLLAATVARYAWSNNPEGCNLVNSAALPAAPFDTAELDSPTTPA